MGTIASQITSLTIVYSTIYSDADKKTSKLRVAGLCAENSPGTGEFPAQMASNAEMFPFDDVIMCIHYRWCYRVVLSIHAIHVHRYHIGSKSRKI